MVNCTFCGKTIERGTGTMFVRVDGSINYFCSTKCEKNTNKLKRKPRETPWTTESRLWKESGGAGSSTKKSAKGEEL
ncbi:50S ribosomal protein L24e [Candidatus Woesearchaeota archaeon]|nr:50S ribosomal protein L24e [Candidatus Woesearchaeota archaeon]